MHLKLKIHSGEIQRNVINATLHLLRRHLKTHSGEKSLKLQPMWICVCSARQFEDRFENSPRRQIIQGQPMPLDGFVQAGSLNQPWAICFFFHSIRYRSRFGFFYLIQYDIDWYFWPQKWPFFKGSVAWQPFFWGEFLMTFFKAFFWKIVS